MSPPLDREKQRKSTIRSRIAVILAEEILANPQAPDFPIASEKQLCERFQASRVTVRLALSDLEHRGLVYRHHGRGTFAHGQSTRRHRDLALLAPPDALKLRSILEIIRGIQSVLAPLRSSLLLMNASPLDWPSESATSLGGILVVQDSLTSREILALETRKLPFLRMPEWVLARDDRDFFHLGRRVAEILTHAATTSKPIDPIEWSDLDQKHVDLHHGPIQTESHERQGFLSPGHTWLSLSSEKLGAALKLVQRKETIQARIAEVNRKLVLLASGQTTPERPLSQKPVARSPQRRLAMKNALIKQLQSAGKEGMTIKDLALSIGKKPENVSVWLYTTGKTVPGLQRIGRGKFAYQAVETFIAERPVEANSQTLPGDLQPPATEATGTSSENVQFTSPVLTCAPGAASKQSHP